MFPLKIKGRPTPRLSPRDDDDGLGWPLLEPYTKEPSGTLCYIYTSSFACLQVLLSSMFFVRTRALSGGQGLHLYESLNFSLGCLWVGSEFFFCQAASHRVLVMSFTTASVCHVMSYLQYYFHCNSGNQFVKW